MSDPLPRIEMKTSKGTILLEMFEDYVYLIAIIGSVIGAAVAWILSAWRRALSPDQEQLLRPREPDEPETWKHSVGSLMTLAERPV